ncbi:MAG: hypothetical protein A2X56_03625 [Nitrospirae bacterium GWC2_57_13]|nr:MAG: hypothetical protein A2X56_03625 [Nitrospirae bacterium GWC2_57_13]HAR41209.1 hypothetical protein [Bdellovibrionales bacterium]
MPLKISSKFEPLANLESMLLFAVSFFAISVFFTKSGISVFGLLSTALLISWRFLPAYRQDIALPKDVFILTVLLFLNILISAHLSENQRWALSEVHKYRHVLIAGLLFSAPLRKEYRKAIVIVFFISAAFDSIVGMLQVADVLPKGYDRPHGCATHPILYAADLAFVCGASLVLLVVPNNIFSTKKAHILLAITALLTFTSILLSQSRGVWLALIPACIITLYLYDRKKTVFIAGIIAVLCALFFLVSPILRQRAVSIVTSAYTESEAGSTGNRIELWKGALIIFSGSPVFGTGYGDFEPDINGLIKEKKIKDISVTLYAHNIFLQALATRGIIGFAILSALFVAILRWGWHEIRKYESIGGYIIILSTLLTVIGGLTENNIEIHRFLAAYCFTLGALGPWRPGDVPDRRPVQSV